MFNRKYLRYRQHQFLMALLRLQRWRITLRDKILCKILQVFVMLALVIFASMITNWCIIFLSASIFVPYLWIRLRLIHTLLRRWKCSSLVMQTRQSFIRIMVNKVFIMIQLLLKTHFLHNRLVQHKVLLWVCMLRCKVFLQIVLSDQMEQLLCFTDLEDLEYL